MEQLLTRTPPACRQLRARISARIAAVRPPPPADPCVAAEARWTGGLRSSTDRAALQRFIADTPAQCAIVRDAAQQRLASLPATAVTRPPPQVNPCDAAETAWAALRASSDIPRLQRFVRETPASCSARGQAEARIATLQQASATMTTATTASTPAWRAGQEFDDCNGAGWCPRMVVIPAGSFMMGSPDSEQGRQSDEGPQRRVSVRQFAAAKFEVTFDQWAACANRGGCTGNANPSDQGWGRGTRPVINVSWNDAQEYVRWLSRETHQSYRLLSEAEWEYAARGGTTSTYATGASITTGQANFNNTLGRTQTVGAYAANPFGLFDMHGNVYEWTQDCAASYSGLPTDGSAYETNSCSSRVYRGGGWNYNPQSLRSADRSRVTPAYRSSDLGFRVARTL